MRHLQKLCAIYVSFLRRQSQAIQSQSTDIQLIPLMLFSAFITKRYAIYGSFLRSQSQTPVVTYETVFCLFVFWLKLNLFIHRNHKFNKQVQKTQKQYAYLSVTYRQNDNYTDIYDGKMTNCGQKVSGPYVASIVVLVLKPSGGR